MWMHQQQQIGIFLPKICPTERQLADMNTKPNGGESLQKSHGSSSTHITHTPYESVGREEHAWCTNQSPIGIYHVCILYSSQVKTATGLEMPIDVPPTAVAGHLWLQKLQFDTTVLIPPFPRGSMPFSVCYRRCYDQRPSPQILQETLIGVSLKYHLYLTCRH